MNTGNLQNSATRFWCVTLFIALFMVAGAPNAAGGGRRLGACVPPLRYQQLYR